MAAHKFVATMDPRWFSRIPILHALTGRDTKITVVVFVTWQFFMHALDAFEELQTMPAEVSEDSVSLVERLVVLG